MMQAQQKSGVGRFQWNRGGWFGGQLGATLWLILLGGLLMAHGRAVGLAVLGLGLLPNLVGLALWRRRHRWSPYPALQLLIGTAGLSALIAIRFFVPADGSEPTLQLPSGPWFLLIYPGLMLVFHLQERAARRTAG